MKVLIISELSDLSTNDVCDYLSFKGVYFFRINVEDEILIETINFSSNFSLKVKVRNEIIDLKLFDKVWYRRGRFKIETMFKFKTKVDDYIKKSIQYNLFNEELATIENFLECFLLEKTFGNSFKRNVNKLTSLFEAKKIGLKIPSTLISSSKNEFMDFFKNNDSRCISKGVQDNLTFLHKNTSYYYYTSEVNQADISEMDTFFFPSTLQEQIDKKYEVRTFFIDKTFYSMAIFSQNDSLTKVDFRHYNSKCPNRNVPYKLPKNIEFKLNLLMKKLDLDTGSIDLIVTSKNEYVFLEVNPSGQYGMVSIPCNYNLDKLIANKIIKL